MMDRAESADSADSHGEEEEHFEGARPKEIHLLKRMYGTHIAGHRESGESEEESANAHEWLGMDSTRLFDDDAGEPIPPLRRTKSDETVRWVGGTLGKVGMAESIAESIAPSERSKSSAEDGGVEADDDEAAPVTPKRFVIFRIA